MEKIIGFIGLGRMGRPMAMNLADRGYDLKVYDVVPAAVKPFLEMGISAASSVQDIAASCDVIITVLPADQHILSVYTGSGGIIENARDGLLCIEMTSAMGLTMKKIKAFSEEKGADVSFVDAPVSGGVGGAEKGTLTIMMGGEKSDIQKARPYLKTLGSKLLYAGKLGDGKSVKMINQMLNAMNTAAAAEAIYLAERLEIDKDILLDIVNNSSGGSWVLSNNIKKFMIAKQYDAGFKLGLMTKDLRLSLQEAEEKGISLPIARQALEEYEQTLEALGDSVNYNAIGEWINNHNRRI